MWTTDNNHGAQIEFLTGRHLLDGCFPTIGAWVHYGLGALERRPAAVHLDGPAARIAVLGGHRRQLSRPRELGRDPQGRPVQPPAVRPARGARRRRARRRSRPSCSGGSTGSRPSSTPTDPKLRAPDQVVRAGLPHADGRPRGPPLRGRGRSDPPALRARPRRHPPVRPADARGPPPGRARGPLHPGLPRRRRRGAWDAHSGLARTTRASAPRSTSRSPGC